MEVLTPTGPRLTRKGTLSLSPDGTLVTTDGLPVLKKDTTGGQAAPQSRVFRVGQGGPLTFTQEGNIYQDGNNIGALSIREFADVDSLKKIGNALYASEPNSPEVQNPETQVHQGFIETSNVNIVKEMTDMIAATRNFESSQRVIKAYDEMDAKLVNDVPKLG